VGELGRIVRRPRVSDVPIQRAVREAAAKAGIPKPITVHTLPQKPMLPVIPA